MWALTKISLVISFVAFSQSEPILNEYAAIFQACDRGYDAAKLSIPACSRIINEKPPTAIIPNAYINRGNAWKALKNLDEAIKDYTSAIERDPTNDRAFGERGLAWREKGDQLKALSDLTQALAINKNDPNWYFGRAIVYMYNSDDDLAISDLNDTINLNPLFWNAYAIRASLYNNKKDFEKAFSDLDNIISRNPNKTDYLVQRAKLYLDRGEYKFALGDLNRAAEMDGLNLSVRALRSDTLRRLGQRLEAQADANFVLSRGGDNCEGRLAQARLFDDTARIDEAIAAISKCLSAAPTHLLGLIWRGKFYLKQRQYERALADASKADKLYPNTPVVLTIKGQAEGEIDKIDEARASLRLALKVDKEYTAASLALARIEMKDKNYKSAIDILRNLITQRPTSNFEELLHVNGEAQKLLAIAESSIARNQASTEHRVGLIIGNDKYENVPQLISAGYDAQGVATVLQRLGFKITIVRDGSRDAILRAIEDFEAASEKSDWSFVYYAGHGIEINGENYIVPVDASFRVDSDVAAEAISISRLLKSAASARKLRFVVLDACRNNPFLGSMRRQISAAASQGGLARVEPDFGTLVFLAAKQGEVAYDAVRAGTHSPFTAAFIRRLQESDLEVRKFVGLVTDDVLTFTSNKQRPYVFGSLSGRQEYYFK